MVASDVLSLCHEIAFTSPVPRSSSAVPGESQRRDASPHCRAGLLASHHRIFNRHSGLSHPTEEADTSLLEIFRFSYRNPQADSHVKRAVYTWYNMAFLWVIQVSLLLQKTLLSASGYCKCHVKHCSGRSLGSSLFSILGFSHPI